MDVAALISIQHVFPTAVDCIAEIAQHIKVTVT